MRSVELSKAALADLKAIARFTQSRRGARQRNVYLKEIDQVFRTLAGKPQLGKTCDEIRAGYRKHPHGTHVIYFKLPGKNELLIVRILHAAMDVDSNIESCPP